MRIVFEQAAAIIFLAARNPARQWPFVNQGRRTNLQAGFMPLKFNRREMLSASVLAGSAVALNSAQARSISGEVPWPEGQANKPENARPGTYEFHNAKE